LLGDPSIHPVAGENEQTKEDLGISKKQNLQDQSRKERRKYLVSKGNALNGFVNKVEKASKVTASKKTKGHINKLLHQFSMRDSVGKTFVVKQNSENTRAFRNKGVLQARYHIYLQKKSRNHLNQKLLSVKELDGEIVNIQVYARR